MLKLVMITVYMTEVCKNQHTGNVPGESLEFVGFLAQNLKFPPHIFFVLQYFMNNKVCC